jgi:L-amino acid N-acyltransferase YncA
LRAVPGRHPQALAVVGLLRHEPGMTSLIRLSVDADLPAITAIYAHAVVHGTASFEIDPPDEAEMRRRREVLLKTGYPYFVAEIDGMVAGYAYAGPYRPRPAYRNSVEDSVYVDPGRQASGVGRALVTALIQACEERGFRQMVAVIGDSASLGSIRLHESLGFELVGVLKAIGFKHGRWLDSVLMQRPLSEGAGALPAIR